jgi:ankyrin repeat protein
LESKYEPHFILFGDLFEILIASVQGQAGEVILVLDGIDKIASCERGELVNGLVRRLDAATIPNLKIVFTSRPCSTTQRSMQALENRHPSIHIRGDDPIPAYQISDIGTYIRHRAYQLATRRCLLQNEHPFLLGQLTTVPSKTYLWAEYVIDEIEAAVAIPTGSIRAMVGTVPNIVQREYAELLRWSADYGPAKTILHMIIAARRPLSLKELAGALEALGTEHIQIEPMHRFRHSIREICRLLITTTEDVVQFVHLSVRKFLLEQKHDGYLSYTAWEKSLWPGESHRILAEACVKYLHCTYTDTYYNKWDELVAMIPQHHFLQYAVQSWHHHVRLADLNDGSAVHQLVLDLLSRDDDVPYFWFRNNMFDVYISPWTPLMKASYLGFSQAATTLLQSDNVKPNSVQKFNRSPFSLAAENGRENIVQLLLDASHRQSILSRMFNRLRIATPDTLGRTPLWYAANGGRVAVVKLLLGTGKVKPDRGDRGTLIPLECAAANGHIRVVRLLAECGLHLNTPDGHRQTPLWYAAAGGHVEVVRFLLGTGRADPDHSTGSITPLMAAVENGHVKIVRLLVETGRVNFAFRDMDETPLMRATRMGHEEIACILRTAEAKSHSNARTMDPDAQKENVVLTSSKEVNSDSDEDETTVFGDDMDLPFTPPTQLDLTSPLAEEEYKLTPFDIAVSELRVRR